MEIKFIILSIIVFIGLMKYGSNDTKNKRREISRINPRPGYLYVYRKAFGVNQPKLYYNGVEILKARYGTRILVVPLTGPGELTISSGRKGITITEADLESYVVVEITFGRYTDTICKVDL